MSPEVRRFKKKKKGTGEPSLETSGYVQPYAGAAPSMSISSDGLSISPGTGVSSSVRRKRSESLRSGGIFFSCHIPRGSRLTATANTT